MFFQARVPKSPAAHQPPAELRTSELSASVPGWLPATGTALPLPKAHSWIAGRQVPSGTVQLQGLKTQGMKSTIFVPSQGEAGKWLPDGKEKSSPDLLIPLVLPMIIKPPPLRREMAKLLHTSPCLFPTVPHASSLLNAQVPQGKQAQPVSPCCTTQCQDMTSCRLPDHSLEQSSQQGQCAKKNDDFRHDVQPSQCCVQHDLH